MVEISTRGTTSEKVRGNNVDFLTSEITPKKSPRKQHGFFDHQSCIEKSEWKQHGFFNQ